MLPLAPEAELVEFLAVASSSMLVWDILDNVKNHCHLLSRHRIEVPTIVYFLSRVFVLGFVLLTTIFLTAPFAACKSFGRVITAAFIIGTVSTMFLSYYRVCAVWHWNRFIIGFFGILWLAVASSAFLLISSMKGLAAGGGHCTLSANKFVMALFVTAFFNHAVVFLAITHGVCRNTIGRNLNFKDIVRLMFGRGSPMFLKALLHDSQVSYIIIIGIALTAMVWYHIWMKMEPNTPFHLALVTPYAVLMNIMICRVFRNTKLGLYSKVPVYSNDPMSHDVPISVISWNSGNITSGARSGPMVSPIQIAINQVVEYKSDYRLSSQFDGIKVR